MAKVNPARLTALLRAVADGNYFRTASESVGVHYTTAYEWIKRGEELIAAERIGNPAIEPELADWLMSWPDNFDADNLMWDASPPPPFFMPDWHLALFAMLMRKARAKAESDGIKTIRDAGAQSWQAMAWWLERTHPDRYGRHQTQTLSHQEASPAATTADGVEVSDEQLIERVRELRAKRDMGE